MPEQSGSGSKVIGCNFHIVHQLFQRLNDRGSLRILQHTVIHGNELFSGRLENAGDNSAVPVRAVDILHLVPVMIGLPHADDRPDRRKLAEHPLSLVLLALKLVRVAFLQLTAAASLEAFADLFAGLRIGNNLSRHIQTLSMERDATRLTPVPRRFSAMTSPTLTGALT